MYVVGMLGWASPHFRKPRVKSWNFFLRVDFVLYNSCKILHYVFLSPFYNFNINVWKRVEQEIGNRNWNARKSQRRRVFLMECGKNLVDIVLQKRTASPPQSLPYTVRKAIEQIGTATSTKR
ncbi:hypothetical protein T12_2203 [Trichinella patagoniensis]|uniref:Uncharacterized protein n=1 Tax=Trichinella patagoniensis TaxID=990121 RepID=A0A0V0Z5V8_9BILA|nr:hypothetical protein T12_2203 [Trichinella patagoniensis]